MAASGGGLAPSPPKRPTIIRPSSDAGVTVPSRPAPPVPGGSRPIPPAAPNRPSAPDKVPSRPQPPPPSKPAGVDKPLPPPPSRPEAAKSTSISGKLSKPFEKSNGSAVKKKPEITIVSARPMSEIGFRDNKPSVPTNSLAEIPSSQPSSQPPATAPKVSPRGDNQEEHDSHDSKGLPRGPPPTVPRNSFHRRNEENAMGEDNETIDREKEIQHRGPPPPVPRPTVIKPSVPLSGASHRQPPLVPGRPLDKPPSDHLSDQHVNDNEPHHISPPRPHGAPPLVPRSPATRNKFSSPEVPHGSTIEAKEIQQSHAERNPDNGPNENDNKVEDVSELYAVINKPKRPTIIRPSRPSVKSEPDGKGQNERLDDDNTKPKVIPPKVSPRVLKSSVTNTESNMESSEAAIQDNTEDSGENPVPEFLRKKLKPTVDVEDKKESLGAGPTAGSGPTLPLKPRPLSSRGPPPATKPKPSILPKPQIATKPGSTVKVSETDQHEANLKAETITEKGTSDSKVISPTQSVQSSDSSNTSPIGQQVKPAMVKRPTIIRPSRSVKTGSVENVNQEINRVTEKSEDVTKPFSDDSAIGTKSHMPPPLPNKRPVSMINIHKAVEDEDQNISESLNLMSSRSTENVNETMKPRPSPRPATRSRPMSMMVPPVSRPPLPNAGPKLDKSSLPLRPQGRPSVRPATRDIEHHVTQENEKETFEESVKTRVPFGVSVLPRPETEQLGPPKPGRRPPPPKSPQKTSDSSDDEEFVSAKDKPDRPPAGPARRTSGSVRRDSSGEETIKPPRPGPPPSPQKGSISTGSSPEKEDDDPVEPRPARPGARPQRPMSMPVKQILPSKPQPPRPHGPKSTKLPPLPSRPKPGHPLYFHMMQVPHGIALHDYPAQHDDELSFKTGELIILERRVDAEWILGKVDEREGMFPQDFVKVKMPLPGETMADDDSSNDSAEIYYDASAEKPDNIGHGPRCRARFDFDGEGPDDLVFEEGDVIRLIERAGLEWRKGEINGMVGLFPLNFVEIIEDLPEENESDKGNVVKAVFDFEGEDGDLDFQAGEMIKVTHMVNEEWLYGEIGTKKGQFPVQFLDHVPHGLPPLASGVADSKGSNSAKHEPVDKISASLSLWDDHDENASNTDSSVITPSANSQTESSSSGFVSMATTPAVTPYCIAVYDYPPQTDGDLGFSEGDRIELVERISADWLKGKLGNTIGMFPSGFVDVKVDIDTNAAESPPAPKKITKPETYGVALYEFTGEADNELTFKEGDRILVEDLVEGAEDWRWGVRDGHRGMFPDAFVQVES